MRKLILAIVGVLLGSLVFVLLSGSSNKGEQAGFGIPLARAAVSANFLEEEAGIAAYFKVPSNINLTLAREVYTVIERDEPGYLLGWIAPKEGSGDGEFNVRVYTASDGWVVAYYLRGEATSKIVDLSTYSGGAFDTRLEQALQRVANATGASMGKVDYYHYGYPTANALMAIVGVDFTFTVPSGLLVSETSYKADTGWIIFVQDTAYHSSGSDAEYGLITTSMPRNQPIEVSGGGNQAIVIVYQQ